MRSLSSLKLTLEETLLGALVGTLTLTLKGPPAGTLKGTPNPNGRST